MKSSSSAGVSIYAKLREGISLFIMHLQRRRRTDFSAFDEMVSEYDNILWRYRNKRLSACKVLEIGFGARPFRLFWLFNIGIDVRGVDLDQPLVTFSARLLFMIWQKNGLERAIKSAVRYFLSDRREFQGMCKALKVRRCIDPKYVPSERLLIADAATPELWKVVGKFDFIYSEDVFEHIPPADLSALVVHMAEALRPNGLALIRPMVFSGICGGHILEWFPHTIDMPRHRHTEPWEHLRRKRVRANTYLNELRRTEFIKIFETQFKILVNESTQPDLGRQYLNEEVRRELAEYNDSELFSNQVLFILEPLPSRNQER
jgi:SAM-dependent methyltransferase